MSRKDKNAVSSAAVVVQVVSSGHMRCVDRIIHRALREAERRGEISHRRINTNCKCDFDRVFARSIAAVSPRALHRRLAERVRAACPFFSLGWLVNQKGRSRKIFFDMPDRGHGFPGAGHGYLDDAGNIRMGGFQGAHNWPWKNAGKLLRGLPGQSHSRQTRLTASRADE